MYEGKMHMWDLQMTTTISKTEELEAVVELLPPPKCVMRLEEYISPFFHSIVIMYAHMC